MDKRVVLILWVVTAFPSVMMAQDKHFIVQVKCESDIPTDILVIPATLKYDKEFAFSFTFDDTHNDAFNLGYKLLSGGYSSVDGNTYPGLFSTDGCGNRFPFRAGIAWITANSDMIDLHKGTLSYLTYAEATVLYQSGWDFFNHSYNHEANNPSIDYRWQLTANSQTFKDNTGIDLNYHIPPAGDNNYLDPAFSVGIAACFTSGSEYIGFAGGADVMIPVPSIKPVYWRQDINSDDDSAASLKRNIDLWVATTGQGNQKWWNEFTHRIEYTHIASSVEFPEFREYFEYMEQKYGSSGRDNGWFASSAEVFEYLKVRDKIVIQLQKNDSVLDIHLDYSQVPANLRYYDLSILIKNPVSVQSVSASNQVTLAHSVTSNGYLINIDIPDSHFSGVDPVANGIQTLLNGYPNPSNGKYYLQIPHQPDQVDISITNMMAEIMPRPDIRMSAGLISMEFTPEIYPPGLYIIRVISRDHLIGFSKVFINY